MIDPQEHHRVSPEGRKAGLLFSVLAEKECATLAQEHGEPDERCKTCALRAGTVPNGCFQTQGDLCKALVEDVPFMCHSKPGKDGRFETICHGWFAVSRVFDRARAAGVDLPASAPWDFTPEDAE